MNTHSSRKIGVGLIGVGNWGRYGHIPVLRLLPNYEIVAVASRRKLVPPRWISDALGLGVQALPDAPAIRFAGDRFLDRVLSVRRVDRNR